jgi:phospholipid/cholesterol/gamma-HCH transport system permease protein
MRVTEQIDALEVMGINPLNFSVFPKNNRIIISIHFIVTIMFVGILGGYLASKFIYGLGMKILLSVYKMSLFHGMQYAFINIYDFWYHVGNYS